MGEVSEEQSDEFSPIPETEQRSEPEGPRSRVPRGD